MAKKKNKDEGLFDVMLAETMKEPEDEDIKFFSEGGDIEDSAVASTSNRYRSGHISRGAGGAFTGIKFKGVK